MPKFVKQKINNWIKIKNKKDCNNWIAHDPLSLQNIWFTRLHHNYSSHNIQTHIVLKKLIMYNKLFDSILTTPTYATL